MDITSIFNDALIRNNAEPISKPVFDASKLNEFLQEAYRINKHISELVQYLRSIRPSYLTLQPHRPFASRKNASRETRSTSHPLSDNDRVRIDHETATLLSNISNAIKQLSSTAELDSQLSAQIIARRRNKLGLGALGRWAAGGGMIRPELSPEEEEEEAKREQLRVFREAVIWFLSRRLEGAGNSQRDMVEMRLDREREKAKSMLYRAKGPGTIAAIAPETNGLDTTTLMDNGAFESRTALESENPSSEGWDSLSPEQLQLFEREQEDMLRHYNEELNKIKTAESSLLEISQLQSQLAMNLETQSAHIDQLVQDSYVATENVGRGNKELKKASERPGTARTVFWATSALCAVVLVCDLIF